jgi:hypothetical protein
MRFENTSARDMRAVDANLVVRLVVRDDPEQVELAEKFISSGAWVSHLVLVETIWVLDAVYERTAEHIATASAPAIAVAVGMPGTALHKHRTRLYL